MADLWKEEFDEILEQLVQNLQGKYSDMGDHTGIEAKLFGEMISNSLGNLIATEASAVDGWVDAIVNNQVPDDMPTRPDLMYEEFTTFSDFVGLK